MNKLSISAKEIFDQYAQVYEERFMDVSIYAQSLNQFCSHLSENAQLLELGCGPGNVTRFLLDQLPKVQILATDVSPNMLELAKKNAPAAKIAELDCRDILSLGQKFDAIVAAFCMPYLTLEEAQLFIQDCSKMLHEDGMLYLSTMEGEADRCGVKLPSSGIGPGTYMAFYTENFLRTNLENVGFSVTFCERAQQSPESDIDLLLIARRAV